MVTPSCPKCRRPIPAADVNVASDVAFCRSCNVAHQLSALAHGSGIDPNIDATRPLAGTWLRTTPRGAVIGASQRSISGAIFTLFFGLFWNGIVSVFVLIALAGTLAHFGVALPSWFPTPPSMGNSFGLGVSLFLWLFLTPFILVGVAMIAGFILALGGKTEARIRDAHGELFTGVGPVGWTRRFNAGAVKDVWINSERWRDSDGDRRKKVEIVIDFLEGKPLRFGSGLPEERRQFLAAALRQVLLDPKR